jgi:hypothetical protein
LFGDKIPGLASILEKRRKFKREGKERKLKREA